MNNKKKNMVIIVFILILVFILIISVLPDKKTSSSLNPYDSQIAVDTGQRFTCEQRCNRDIKCLEGCYYVDINKAVLSGNINSCNDINSLLKQVCVDKINLKKAFIANDKNLCNNIVTTEIKNYCLGELI